jgi:hypothetical protein
MVETSIAELEALAKAAARDIAGPDAVEQVEVEPVFDLDDRVAYQFTFLFSQKNAKGPPGLAQVDLALKLLDELEARGDEHRPLLRFLDQTDWEKRHRARLYPAA